MVAGDGAVAELWQPLHEDRLSMKSRFPEKAWRELGLETAQERAAAMRTVLRSTTINALQKIRSK
jgi:hypothetical protein